MYNSEYYKKYYRKNKEKILGHHKKYRQNNPDYMSLYWKKNKEKLRYQSKVYRTKNKGKIKLMKKEYYNKNKDLIKVRSKLYYRKDTEKIKSKKREYYVKNKIKFKEKQKKFYRNNPNYKKQEYHKNREKILARRKIDRKLYLEKWKKYELNYKDRKRVIDALRHQKHKELENQRRKLLGLPLIGENYKAEHEMKLYLNKIIPNDDYKDNRRYEWLNGMELDRYYPMLNLAFEYHGEQHFRDIKFFKINLEEIQKRDELKRELCRKNGVVLIEIPYFEKISEQLILSKLKDWNLPLIQGRFIKRN